MKQVTCPNCKGAKKIKEVQSVKLESVDVVGFNADGSPKFEPKGSGDVLEYTCPRCKGKGEVPDISFEDQERASAIVDAWTEKEFRYENMLPDTDDLVEAVAVALVEEVERGRREEYERCMEAVFDVRDKYALIGYKKRAEKFGLCQEIVQKINSGDVPKDISARLEDK